MKHAVCSKISKGVQVFQHFSCRHVDMFCFVTGLGCHYSPLHIKLRTQTTLAQIQVLQQHFQCHNQYHSLLTVSVCKHTAVLLNTIHVLSLLAVLQRCNMNSFPGLSQQNSCPNRYKEPIKTVGKSVNIRHEFWFFSEIRNNRYRYFHLHWLRLFLKCDTLSYVWYRSQMDSSLLHHFIVSSRQKKSCHTWHLCCILY